MGRALGHDRISLYLAYSVLLVLRAASIEEGTMNSEKCSIHPVALPASLLTEKELATAVRLSPAKLQKLRREGDGPAFVRIGSSVRYPVAGVDAWLHSLTAK